MDFREALRTGFFELQQSRDKYRELCGAQGMQESLVRQFIEWQALALSPVCPHVADYIWRHLLAKPTSIVTQIWPQVPPLHPDEAVFIKSSEYLMEAARDFRLKLKASQQPPKPNKKGQAPAAPKKPTHATLYVAKTYPPWQCTVLSTLKRMYEAGTDPPDNKAVSQELGKMADLKKFMKKVMPFVAFTKERIANQGMSALDLSLEFDELKVLQDNVDYVTATLQLEGVSVQYSSEASDKIQEECRPGTPFVVFRSEPSVQIKLINNQPHTGLFSVPFPVLDGDSKSSMAKRLHRQERNVKDPKRVQWFRFQDPELGPRKMPSLTNPLEGKIEIGDDETFKIDVENNIATLESKGSQLDFGNVLIYRV